MGEASVLIEVGGTYGGRSSRDEILRNLKEALALVENAAPDAELTMPGWRIDVLSPGKAKADYPPASA